MIRDALELKNFLLSGKIPLYGDDAPAMSARAAVCCAHFARIHNGADLY